MNTQNILLSTIESVPGHEVSTVLGLVKGNTVRARHIGSDITAGLKSLIGGEIKSYVKAMTDAREEALERMLNKAKDLGADAVIGMRFSTSQIMEGSAEILVYGTAVKIQKS